MIDDKHLRRRLTVKNQVGSLELCVELSLLDPRKHLERDPSLLSAPLASCHRFQRLLLSGSSQNRKLPTPAIYHRSCFRQMLHKIGKREVGRGTRAFSLGVSLALGPCVPLVSVTLARIKALESSSVPREGKSDGNHLYHN